MQLKVMKTSINSFFQIESNETSQFFCLTIRKVFIRSGAIILQYTNLNLMSNQIKKQNITNVYNIKLLNRKIKIY